MGRKNEIARRMTSLRAALRAQGLDGLIVPHADEYQNEYIPACAERLAWISGFSGSAGCAVILQKTAALFVDGRYTLQAELETDPALFTHFHLINHPPARWIAESIPEGTRLGFDPWLHTDSEVRSFRHSCDKIGAKLIACESNPIDAIWSDRPAPPSSLIVAHPERYAGESSADKRERIGKELEADALIVCSPDSLAWLFNIRGQDVRYTPLALARAIFYRNGTADLFTDPAKVTPELLIHLGSDITVCPASDFPKALAALEGKSVRVDQVRTPFSIVEHLQNAKANVQIGTDPCQLAKACKNNVELNGMRSAHRRDGAALCRFLAWLSEVEETDECTAAERLGEFRKADPLFREESFATISGAGPNGAIIHYHATPESNRPLQPGQLYLVDSGGQYLDGTTDVTRTIAIAPKTIAPGAKERHHFTLVLKGHIALTRIVFPKGTTGSQLDVLARRHLWAEGLDYDHGTGHGVGCYLGVHEGPQRISKQPNMTALLPGMIISNEPGYYKPGAYGIRIENLLAVCEAPRNAAMLHFEPLTLAPIYLNLVEPGLLDISERAWLNRYHARIFKEITPLVDAKTRKWLEKATKPI